MDYRFSKAFNAAQRKWDNATPEEEDEFLDDDTQEEDEDEAEDS